MKKIVVSIFALLLAASVHAKPTIQAVQAAMPTLPKITSITETPMKGIYQVATDSTLFFVDNDLKYLVAGAMFDIKTKTNISEPAIEKLRANMAQKTKERSGNAIASIKLENAVAEVKGTGKRILYVFTDPLCPYCKRFESTLETMTDVTIYRFIVPFKGPKADAITEKVWCSTDKLAAWKDASMGKALPENKCATPTSQNMELAQALSVSGTPTSFKPNGEKQEGAMDKVQLEAWLAK